MPPASLIRWCRASLTSARMSDAATNGCRFASSATAALQSARDRSPSRSYQASEVYSPIACCGQQARTYSVSSDGFRWCHGSPLSGSGALHGASCTGLMCLLALVCGWSRRGRSHGVVLAHLDGEVVELGGAHAPGGVDQEVDVPVLGQSSRACLPTRDRRCGGASGRPGGAVDKGGDDVPRLGARGSPVRRLVRARRRRNTGAGSGSYLFRDSPARRRARAIACYRFAIVSSKPDGKLLSPDGSLPSRGMLALLVRCGLIGAVAPSLLSAAICLPSPDGKLLSRPARLPHRA